MDQPSMDHELDDWLTLSEEESENSKESSAWEESTTSDSETDGLERFSITDADRIFFADFAQIKHAQEFQKEKPITFDDDLSKCPCKHCWIWQVYDWADEAQIEETRALNKTNKKKSKKKELYFSRSELPIFNSESFEDPIDPTAYYLEELGQRLIFMQECVKDVGKCVHRTTSSAFQWIYNFIQFQYRRGQVSPEQKTKVI